MRIAYIGVSHWHARMYLEPVVGLPGTTLVGVSDTDPARAEQVAAGTGTTAYTDYRAMVEATRPDLVFALGTHDEMPHEAEYLIGHGVAFGMEKPCGTTVADIARITALAMAENAFAAVPFTFRTSDLVRLIREHSPGKELTYAMFRMFPGPVSRYRDWGVEWNLDRRRSGGGSTLNLGIHFFDLLPFLAPEEPWMVASATMSDRLTNGDVEDFSLVTLRSGSRTAIVETGYSYPLGTTGEQHYSICMEGDWYQWDGAGRRITIALADGREFEHTAPENQAAYYPDFIRDTIERVRDGRKPLAGLPDVLAAATLAESAYRMAGYDDSMV